MMYLIENINHRVFIHPDPAINLDRRIEDAPKTWRPPPIRDRFNRNTVAFPQV